ncbi:MAG: SIMPL domain-containing protein [Thalassolituus sp.]
MKRIATVFTALALSFITLAFTSTTAIAQTDGQAVTQVVTQSAYIDVSGNGEVEAFPDYLTLSIELQDTNMDVSVAKDKVDEAFAQISTIAKKLGIKKDDIESVLIRTTPQWQYNRNSERTLLGYQVTRPVTLNLRNLKVYGELLETLVTDEIFRITSTQLKFDEPEVHQSKARRLALLNAKAKAEEMAATLDQKITGVLWIQEQGRNSPRPMAMESYSMVRSASLKQADTGSEMQIQEQTISQQVQVRFSIIPD